MKKDLAETSDGGIPANSIGSGNSLAGVSSNDPTNPPVKKNKRPAILKRFALFVALRRANKQGI